MSRLYDRAVPAVIDNAMLNQCIQEQLTRDDSGVVAEGNEHMNKRLVLHLRLDYKNILRIENLWEFRALTKLQLDNNIIEKIEGLDKLIHLDWLDLSFNNIEVIEGLDALTKLTNLSLSYNRIQKLGGLENLKQLQIFCIGHNKIKEPEEMQYLRPFGNLQSLSISGNPCSSVETCQPFVIAYIPTLVYLDYRRINKESRLKALEMFQEQIEALELKEKEESRLTEDAQKKSEEEGLYKRAYIDGMAADEFFPALFNDDAEASVLPAMPQTKEVLNTFCEIFTENCKQIIEIGLTELKKRETEREEFFTCLRSAVESNRQAGIAKVNTLLTFKKQVMELDGDALDAKLTTLESDLTVLNHNLMDLEIGLVEQIEEVTKEFERNYAELVNGFIEAVQGHFTQCREAEAKYCEDLTEVCQEVLDKLMKKELEEDLPDEARVVFMDKDSLTSALQTAHDNHALCIDTKEDKMLNRARADLKALIEDLSANEMQRNRGRIAEIQHFIESVRDEILQMGSAADLDDDL